MDIGWKDRQTSVHPNIICTSGKFYFLIIFIQLRSRFLQRPVGDIFYVVLPRKHIAFPRNKRAKTPRSVLYTVIVIDVHL